ncbi:hypothetical protein AG1IA_02579 [Rhizoctonia solani AG-1 IA]|uniref:Phosphatidate phosphatase APP1 catalytic domain-containing protein n=1 Tax=Thanatephorus cucumeris (strain AG1-IA) TaxID=983506 RepID=L8WZJ3_THACA|nr:hypothetical protein AG1IA_02579 [Rhizoctonia solani AG-1 IA]
MNYLYSRPENPRAGSASGSMTGGWRNAALARFAKVRDYVASSEVPKSAYAAVSNRVAAYRNGFDPVTGEKRQTWEEWAREKRQRRREEQRGAEKLALFPGWAVRRYPNEGSLVSMKHDEVQRFAVDIFVSGFASSLRTPDQATRSQKAFMRLARGFSALPRLPPPPEDILGGPGTESPLAQSPNPSTDDLNEELERMGIILPPRPDEITKETEAKALESRTKPKVKTTQDSRIVDYGSNDASNLSTKSNPTLSISGLRPQSPPLPHRSPTIITQTPSPGTSPIKNIRSNTVGSISSMLSVNSTRSNTDVGSIHPDMDIGILRQLHANLDGRLQPFWSSKLDNRTVRIKLYAQPYSSRRTQDSTPIQVVHVKTTPQGYFSHKFRLTFEDLCTHDQTLGLAFGDHTADYTFHAHAELLPAVYPSDLSTAGAEASREIEVGDATVRAETELPLTAAHVRLISDVDDTVKISEVLMGVRAIFHNVSSAPGAIYRAELTLSKADSQTGHLSCCQCSWSFLELQVYPRVFKVPSNSNHTEGETYFKSAADRKRGNVMEILDNFSQSKFILVGDSGEQDLELYSALAEERPDQILAIFIRDVTPPTPPATAPSSPTLGPTDDNIIKKKGSTSSLRSIRSLAGGGKIAKEPPGKIQTPALMKNPTTISQSSQPSTPKRSGSRSVTDPPRSATSPTTPYQVYTRSRGASGSYFDSPTTPTRPVPPTPPPYIRSPPTNQGIELDPAGALVSAAATAGTGHSADATVDTTRAGILAKKEALRLRTDAARRRIPNGVIFRVFKEPSECEDDANRVIDSLESAST